MSIESIRARLAQCKRNPFVLGDELTSSDVDLLLSAPSDLELLLAVAEAAKEGHHHVVDKVRSWDDGSVDHLTDAGIKCLGLGPSDYKRVPMCSCGRKRCTTLAALDALEASE